ncbi:hypothetical protein TRICHSKD4_3225 [Roseibium sp. TrichSKD4]|uniref:GcrA family cell cycle regulator n=1 Tax=Roseibium sp. TrichSKD4 TaxID=744980 RepID=UPI0001E56D99|nr:GcrA family cell cycle regulator [Roseibium sp. TrichSKD4]EFO31531.1 hypothetical protein TRICHSKD4_3225 [Roseibium sp. TrichSKD4]
MTSGTIIEALPWAALTAREKTKAVSHCFEAGLTVAETAERLSATYGVVSDGAVRGLAFRQGLRPNRDADREAFDRLKADRAMRGKSRVKSSPAPRVTPEAYPVISHEIRGSAVNIFTVKQGQCRFPLWGHQKVPIGQKLFCGKPAIEGQSFCPACYERTHRRPGEGE